MSTSTWIVGQAAWSRSNDSNPPLSPATTRSFHFVTCLCHASFLSRLQLYYTLMYHLLHTRLGLVPSNLSRWYRLRACGWGIFQRRISMMRTQCWGCLMFKARTILGVQGLSTEVEELLFVGIKDTEQSWMATNWAHGWNESRWNQNQWAFKIQRQ